MSNQDYVGALNACIMSTGNVMTVIVLRELRDKLSNGYTLCKADSAISGMNSLYAKAEEYAKADEVVGDCIDILKEACL